MGGNFLAEFILKSEVEYRDYYRNKNTGFEMGYLTPNDLKALYPDGGVRVAGQIGCGSDEIGSVSVGDTSEKVYRPKSGVRYKTVGYTELQDGSFLAVKKDIIALIILLIIIGLLVLAGLVAGITAAVRANSDADDGSTTTTSPYALDEDQQQGLGELDLPSKVDVANKSVTITGITEMKLKANQLQQNFILSNSEENEGICFMTFTIYIDKDKDKEIDPEDNMIYKSSLVRPGYSISKFSLNQKLEAGEYQVIILEQPYSYDQARTPLNRMIVSAKLIVE